MDLNSSGGSDWGSMSAHTSGDSLADSLSLHDDGSSGGLMDVVKSEDIGSGFSSEIPSGELCAGRPQGRQSRCSIAS